MCAFYSECLCVIIVSSAQNKTFAGLSEVETIKSTVYIYVRVTRRSPVGLLCLENSTARGELSRFQTLADPPWLGL